MRPRIAIPADTLTEATNVINERNAPFAPRPAIEAIVKSGEPQLFCQVLILSLWMIISTCLMGSFLRGI